MRLFPHAGSKLALQSVALDLDELRQGTLGTPACNRALTRPEIIALANLHPAPAATHTIALIDDAGGGADAGSSWLDAYLAQVRRRAGREAHRPAQPRLEGDVDDLQDRPLNFGAGTAARPRARRVVVMLGRQEIERGEAGLADFRRWTHWSRSAVGRCCSWAASPLIPSRPRRRDALNPVLARYDDAIKAVAEARGGILRHPEELAQAGGRVDARWRDAGEGCSTTSPCLSRSAFMGAIPMRPA